MKHFPVFSAALETAFSLNSRNLAICVPISLSFKLSKFKPLTIAVCSIISVLSIFLSKGNIKSFTFFDNKINSFKS